MYKVTMPVVVDNGHFNKEKILRELKRAKADRVGLALSRALNPLYGGPEKMAFLKELIDYYRAEGFEILVWIGETMGHCPCSDEWALNRYTQLRHLSGNDGGVFCIKDANFTADMCEYVQEVAKCGPDLILLDDDFRIANRGDGLGCCCDLHMADIRAILGEDIDIPTLREKILTGGKNKYRDAWMKAQGDALLTYSKALRTALDEVDPTIRLGWCNSSDSWGYSGINVIERATALAGNTQPFVRTCGAPYWVANWRYPKRRFFFGETIEYGRLQCSWLKGTGIETMSEGDTYPRPRTECPASYMECFDMIHRAAGDHDGILKYSFDYTSDADYETGYVDMQVENEPMYAEIERIFGDKTAVGVRPYIVPMPFEYRDTNPNNPTEDDDISYDMYCPSNRMSTFASLPISYEPGCVNILFGENAKYITEEELNCGNVIDITAAKFLMDRGVDVGIERIYDLDRLVLDEYDLAEQQYVSVDGMGVVKGCDLKEGTELISKFHLRAGNNIFVYSGSGEMVPGVFKYENARGQRFLVLPFDGTQVYDKRGWLDSYIRRRHLVKNVEWLGGKKLDAWVDDNSLQLYLLVKKNEKSMSVGLWNLYPDRLKNLKVHVATDSDKIEFVGCTGHREGDCIVLDSTLYPYEMAAFEIKL